MGINEGSFVYWELGEYGKYNMTLVDLVQGGRPFQFAERVLMGSPLKKGYFDLVESLVF